MSVPASRYRPSSRGFPKRLPEPEYDSGEILRKVPKTRANVNFKGKLWYVPQAFCGETLAIRQLDREPLYGVFFGATQIAKIDLDAKH